MNVIAIDDLKRAHSEHVSKSLSIKTAIHAAAHTPHMVIHPVICHQITIVMKPEYLDIKGQIL